ncbi:MAG: SAP domain-containing protein [Candidatus Omnitrophota bacterium]|nr:SAP domain-containing protein [Candidatus Omnitrophota bacterium]
MRLLEVERKARRLGVKDTWKYSKDQLIRSVQRAEGFSECFATGRTKNTCDQLVCSWRSDCVR